MKTLSEILAMPLYDKKMQCVRDFCEEQLTHVGYYYRDWDAYCVKVYYSSKCAPFGTAYDIQPLNIEREERQ